MNACTRHLWQPKQRTTASIEDIKAEGGSKLESAILPDAADDVSAQFGDPAPETIGSDGLNGEGSSKPPRIVEIPSTEPGTAAPSVNGTPAPEDVLAGAPGDADTTPTLGGDGDNLSGTVPTVPQPAAPGIEYVMPPGFDVFKQSSQSALDGAIAASISQAGSENRIKAAAGNILLIGGASALKGLPGILQDRYVATRTFICSMLATPHWDPGTGSDARVGYGRL
jgi:actin-related protein